MSKKSLMEDMKRAPQRFYRAPSDVIRDRRFSDAERLEILSAWEAIAGENTTEYQQAAEARDEIERKRASETEEPLT